MNRQTQKALAEYKPQGVSGLQTRIHFGHLYYVCKCNKGYASAVDGLCRRCRGFSLTAHWNHVVNYMVKNPRAQNPHVQYEY